MPISRSSPTTRVTTRQAAVEKRAHDDGVSSTAKLDAELQRVATAMYDAAGKGQGQDGGAGPGASSGGAGPGASSGGASSGGKGKGDVIDAEFEETK